MADELRGRAVPLARFGAAGLRLRALAGLLLALERRRIAHPRLRTTPMFKVGLQQRSATGEMGIDQIALQNS